jgi:E3 ubiquitin-protein ligase synoviolin
MLTVLSTLWIIDILLIIFAADSILLDGPSVMIMFASEYMIMLATLLGTTFKYGVNVHDLRRSDAGDTWENKSVYTFYIDLACDFLKLATYLCFFSLILTFYGLPLNILRDVYITARSFAVKVRDLIRYRRATKNMDERYPNATAEELERLSDKTCIICREEMEARAPAAAPATVPAPAGAAAPAAPSAQPAAPAPTRSGPNNTPKKLPCAHIFHFHCLRSWLERQQSCPTW